MSDVLPPAPETIVLADGMTPPPLTSRRDTDARTALVRGLAEYLTKLVGDRVLPKMPVRTIWAEPEQVAHNPALVVTHNGRAAYDAKSFTPQLTDVGTTDGGLGIYLSEYAEFVQPIQVTLIASSIVMRSDIAAILESAFNPNVETYGLRLVLPFYFNQVAAYELTQNTYLDDEDSAIARMRRVTFDLTGQVAAARTVTRSRIRHVFTDVTVTVDENVTVVEEVTVE